MQTVWSRVAQSRGTCCCPQCFQSVSGVSRRAAASTTRQAPRFLTSSTLWYSGIFAAAATYDAGIKKQRREQWDQAIADVKQELGQPAETGRTPRREQQHGAPLQSQRADDPQDAEILAADVFRNVEPRQRQAPWPTNTGPPLITYHLPPQSVYARDFARRQAECRRWTPKKLEMTMLHMDVVQLKLFLAMLKSGEGKWSPELSAAVPAGYRDKMLLSEEELKAAIHAKKNDLYRLKSADRSLSDWNRSEGHEALSHYSQDDLGAFHVTARDLNKSLQDLFRQHMSQSISTPSLLAKVAYNLHVSSAPPNINTFNTLILGLAQAQQRLVPSIIRALQQTHVRPNEVTNTAILNYYTAANDASGFISWVELMRGKNGGLMLARPDIRLNGRDTGRLIVKEARDDAPYRKVIQLPYPTPEVFGAIIKGVLKFSGFETALGICEGMGHEGWGLCMGGLTPLLIDCADRGDWQAGLAVWRQIQALHATGARRLSRENGPGEPVSLETYAAMLRLCSTSGQRSSFQDIWRQAMRTHRQQTTALMGAIQAQDGGGLPRRHAVGLAPSASDQPRQLPASDAAPAAAPAAACVAAPDDVADLAQDDSPGSQRDGRAHPDGVEAAGTTTARPSARRRRRPLHTDQENPPADRRLMHDRPYAEAPRSTATTVLRTRPIQPPRAAVLGRERLEDWLPSGQELDDYEWRERPLTMHG